MRWEEFFESMRPILSLWKLPKTEAEKEHDKAYLNTILDSIGWMDSTQFDEVCRKIAQTAGGMKKPMPKDFIGAFKDLSSRHNWTKEKVNSCQQCEGLGLVDTSITNTETLEHHKVMKPCPGCRSDTGMKDGWIEDVPPPIKSENKATNWMLNEIEQDYYPPKAAQDLLVKIDEEKINFPEEVVKALVEKAGK